MSVCVRGCRLLIVLLCLTVTSSLIGCGPGNPLGRKAVSGNVTLDGSPIQNGSISFSPVDGSATTSSGAVVLSGKYSIEAADGLTDGKYLVRINAIDPSTITELPPDHMPGDDLPESKELIPSEWNSKSDKTVEVSGRGPLKFDFEITTN